MVSDRGGCWLAGVLQSGDAKEILGEIEKNGKEMWSAREVSVKG